MRQSLKRFESIAESVALMLSPHVEVIIHDLQTETIAYIANSISKRQIGDPSLLQEIDFTPDADVIGPYEKVNFDGRTIRSITAVLRNEDQTPDGVMCVNFDFSPIAESAKLLLGLFGNKQTVEQPPALFKNDWHEKINQFVSAWLDERRTSLSRIDRAQKKQLVVALDNSGAFAGPNAAVYVARVLKLGRATVYKYMNEAKAKDR